jgi:hypothetical protein
MEPRKVDANPDAMASTLTGTEPNQARIQLHVDLTVEVQRETEMLTNFHKRFKPAAARQPGYLDACIMKLRSTAMGDPPGDANYRFVLTFQSEELRREWVASDAHREVWPTIENTLRHKNYTVLLYDVS